MLTNISTSKSNQAMKFSQVIKYNMSNIFLNKSCTKCAGETLPRPFPKNSKFSISLDQQPKILCNFYYATNFMQQKSRLKFKYLENEKGP